MEEEVVNAARDEPSVLDIEYEGLFGGTVTRRDGSYSFTIQNQSKDGCGYGCSRYGLTHIVNCQNSRVAMETSSELVEVLAKNFWNEYLKQDPAAATQGATLQSALDQFKKKGLITGYAKCVTIEQMKNALDAFRLVYTGSLNGDWGKVARERTYGIREKLNCGHIFCIISYDDYGWLAVNSYGEDNGFFHIPYELTDTLFSRYAITDSNDEIAISVYKSKLMEKITIEEAKRAFENRLWSGERPTEPITREEAAAIIQRALDSIKN